MWVEILLVAFGGSLGAICRHELGRRMARRLPGPFPFGTLTVNWIGSFLLGMLISLKVSASVYLLLGTGFMGAFTTFSTFMVDIADRIRGKQSAVALLYILLSLAGGIALAFAGMHIHF